jgi:hypothetical protein
MLGYLEKIKTSLMDLFKLKPKSKTMQINRQHLRENLEVIEKKFKIFIECIDSMPMSYRKRMADKIFDMSSSKLNVGCKEYVAMARTIKGNDLRVYFDTSMVCSKNFLKIIERTIAEFDKIFDNREIRISNVTLGQYAVFGMIDQANIFSKFVSYLLDMISHEVLAGGDGEELDNIPQYKPVFIAKHNKMVYNLAISLKTGYLNYLTSISKVVKSASNVKLINEAGQSNVGMIDPDEHSSNLFIRNATFNPFFFIGETWVLIKHSLYQRTVKEREYLESHIAVLRLQLDGVDPDSPEYQHHVKVINAYNKMLTALDEKIAKYENS